MSNSNSNSNSVCNRCGVDMDTNGIIVVGEVVHCQHYGCTAPQIKPTVTNDSLSWSDLTNKHDRYE